MAKFLLADDEHQIEKIVRYKLEKEGHTLDYAENGELALNMIMSDSSDYDAIILDIMMPKLDGLTLLRKIRNISKYKNIPVIMLTAKSEDYDIKAGFEDGASEYITKPFGLSDFYLKVGRFLKC